MSFFRAVTAATQSIAGSTETALVFGTEVSDPDSVFASNVFTVPSGWNGRVGGLSAGLRTSTDEASMALRIQKQAGGSGSFVTIAENITGDAANNTASAYPIVFATGDVYRVAYFGTVTTKSNDVRNFFAGWVFPTLTKLGMFRAHANTNQTISSGAVYAVDFQVEDADSHSLFASNVLTVSSDFNGGFLQLSAGFRPNSGSGAKVIYIEVSTDGGSSWSVLASRSTAANAGSQVIDLGPIAAVTGHKFRVAYFSDAAGTLTGDERTFFSGMLFKY